MKMILIMIMTLHFLHCKIHVFSPVGLRNKFSEGKIPNTIADFGIVPYGHSISGHLLKAIPFDGCDPLKIPDEVLKSVQGNLILLMERGRCNFSQKVINAQNIGASSVLISDADSTKNVHQIFAVERVKSMLDKVRIPSMLINKKDSNTLAAQLKKHEQIELGMDFELRKAEFKSKLSFILSVDDYRCYDSLLNMKQYFKTFKDSMEVTVHYKVFRNVKVAHSSECLKTQDNKFCILKSFGNNLENQNLMNETLRQMCIYKNSKASFFDYLKAVRKYCFNELDSNIKSDFAKCTSAIFTQFFGSLPSKQSLDTGDSKSTTTEPEQWPGVNKVSKANIEDDERVKVLECSLIDGNQVAPMFEQNNDDIKYYLINYAPLVFINGVYYKGNFDDTTHLLESFCSSFEKEPIQCHSLESFKILKMADTSAFFDYLLKQIFCTAILLAIIGVGFFIFYRKRVRGRMDNELHDKINQAIANYYRITPINLEHIGLTSSEKNNIDELVNRLDQVASSTKTTKSELSVPTNQSDSKQNSVKSHGLAKPDKSSLNLQRLKDQIDSDEEYDCHPNNMTFS